LKKILILSNSSSGLYEFRNEILLDMMTYSEVYVSLPDMDHYYDDLAEEGCHMIHTEFERRGMNPLKDIKLYIEYRKIIKKIKPDFVCTYTIKPNIYGGLASRVSKVPYVCNITGLGTAIQGGGLLSKVLVEMYKVATKKAKTIFFQNEYNKDFMMSHGVVSDNAKLLPGSGVNLEKHAYRDYPSEENGIRILSVLRIMKDKGIEEFFDTVDRLGSKEVQFSLAGNYEEETREKYEPILNRLVEEGKLNYLGFVDEMDDVYASHHVVLHPSYHEGLSNVCLEAAACGRPVLASDVPGCKETIVDNKSGMLFRAKDTEAVTNSVKHLLKCTTKEREAMGLAGREHVEANYDRKIVIAEYREALNCD